MKKKFHKDNEILKTAKENVYYQSINRSHKKMKSLNISWKSGFLYDDVCCESQK